MRHLTTNSKLPKHGLDLLALLVLVFPAHSPQAGEVYKSIDAEGHVVYSDQPPTSTAQKSEVHVNEPNPAEVARIAKEQQILKAVDIQRKLQKAADDKKKAQQDHEHQVQCDDTRNRYYSMKDARRLFQRDADGNRIYYSDQDADARREEARLAMTAACAN